MARYKLKEKSFIDNILYEAGAEVDFDGIPAKHMIPLDAEAKKKAGVVDDANKESAVRMKDAAMGADLSDPDYKPGVAQPAPAAA